MKKLGQLLFLLSWLWLLAVVARPFEPVFESMFRGEPRWLTWLSMVPEPAPLGPLTWANSWPVAAGLIGMLVAGGFVAWAKHRKRKGGRRDL